MIFEYIQEGIDFRVGHHPRLELHIEKVSIPKILAIDSEEIRVAISEQIDAIVETVKIALEQTPPELAADIVDSGIVLTGGGALLKNLDKLLREESGLPITVTEDPLSTVALGSGMALDSIEILKQVIIT